MKKLIYFLPFILFIISNSIYAQYCGQNELKTVNKLIDAINNINEEVMEDIEKRAFNDAKKVFNEFRIRISNSLREDSDVPRLRTNFFWSKMRGPIKDVDNMTWRIYRRIGVKPWITKIWAVVSNIGGNIIQ